MCTLRNLNRAMTDKHARFKLRDSKQSQSMRTKHDKRTLNVNSVKSVKIRATMITWRLDGEGGGDAAARNAGDDESNEAAMGYTRI